MDFWHPHEMLVLGDIVRKDVGQGLQLNNDTMEKLKDALGYIVKGEISGNPLEFKHIAFSRFKKVVDAVINTQLAISAEPVLLNQVLSRARRVHAFWQKRFAMNLSSIDNERAVQLMSTFGRLAFVALDKRSTAVGRPIWFATRRVPGAGFGIRQVELGQ
jgi:hypothetical protein